MPKLSSIWLQAHQLSGWSLALIWIHTFILLFFPLIISRAALHGTWPRTPNYPSLLTQLFHHSPTPPPPPLIALPIRLPHPSPPPLTPEQTAVSDRRGAWEVQPTRQANSSYLTSHLAADRHGGSVQVYTPHPISVESDLSHRMKFRVEYLKILWIPGSKFKIIQE